MNDRDRAAVPDPEWSHPRYATGLTGAAYNLLAAIENGDRANVHGWSVALRKELDDYLAGKPVAASEARAAVPEARFCRYVCPLGAHPEHGEDRAAPTEDEVDAALGEMAKIGADTYEVMPVEDAAVQAPTAGEPTRDETRAAINKAIDYLDPDFGVGPPMASAALATLREARAAYDRDQAPFRAEAARAAVQELRAKIEALPWLVVAIADDGSGGQMVALDAVLALLEPTDG